MSTPVTNFAKVTVSGTYNAAAASVSLTSGHGSRLPSTFPYPLTWWNATDYPDPADDPNKEIITVTSRIGDTLQITRGAEGTSASTKNTASKTYKMLEGITAAMWESVSTNSSSQSFRNLSIRTHYDNDKSAYKVVLLHADAITMDDGEEVADWDMLEADLTASGAGGLDTGSEAASVNYGIYAIAVSGASKSIMFHREKDYLLDEDVTAGEDGQHALRDAAARTRLAQGFQVDTAGPLEFIDVKILKTGSPTGNFWFTVEANAGGVPSNTALATSDKYDVSRLTTTAEWVRIPFRTPYSVSAVTQYHLVLYGDFTVSAVNYMSWRADTTAAAYSKGSKAAYDGATWTTDTDDDFVFKVYITRNDTAVTLPTSYNQQALIGFVYNNASGNLKHFTQKNGRVFTGHGDDWQIGTYSSANYPTLTDLSAFVPGRNVSVYFEAYNATTCRVSVGSLNATDLNTTLADELIGTLKGLVVDRGSLPPINLEYSAVNVQSDAGTLNLYIVGYEW